LNPGQTATLNVEFDPTTAVAATGQLTITSTSSTGATTAIGLSGTGETHEVELTWNAPSSSTDPVAGYHIYRAVTGSTSYQLVNSSQDTQTSYADNTVQSGQGYNYIVKSVDNSGMESTSSNMISVSIP